MALEKLFIQYWYISDTPNKTEGYARNYGTYNKCPTHLSHNWEYWDTNIQMWLTDHQMLVKCGVPTTASSPPGVTGSNGPTQGPGTTTPQQSASSRHALSAYLITCILLIVSFEL